MEHAAQKTRREVEAKAKEEAKKQRLTEEEKKRKRLEYICQLQNKVLVEDAALLEGAEGSQIIGSKYKEIASRDEKEQWSPKKAKGKQSEKYYRDTTIKMGDTNSCKRCVSARQDCLVHHSK